MGIGTTFGAFTTARLGIYASQKALDVVGNNISNINTVGYTRQALDQRSMNLGGADKYSSKYSVRVGTGVFVTSVNQLRDPYLDIRYRSEVSSMSAMQAKLNGLNQISTYLDEVGTGDDGEGVLEAQFNELISMMEELTGVQGIGKQSSDTLVRSAATTLVSTLQEYAKGLETLTNNQDTSFKQDLDNVNSILESIRDLNSSIRKSQIYGSDALELRDQRNNLIDELSQYVRVNVSYEQEDLGQGLLVEKLVIKLAGDDVAHPESNNATLVDGIYAGSLSIRQVPSQDAAGNYLDADGNIVADEADAALVQDPYYRIDVGALEDRNGRTMVLESSTKKLTTVFTQAEKEAMGDSFQKLIDEGRLPTDTDTQKYDYSWLEVKDTDGNVTGYQIQMASRTVAAKVELTDNAMYGGLQAERELLTEAGEYATAEQLAMDPNAATKRGIPYYQKSLDTLANTLAYTLNQANRPYATVYKVADIQEGDQIPADAVFEDADGNYFRLATKTATVGGVEQEVFKTTTDCALDEAAGERNVGEFLTQGQINHLVKGGCGVKPVLGAEDMDPSTGRPLGAVQPLFSNDGNGNDTEGITAANISVSTGWSHGTIRILQSREPDATSTDNSNSLHILSLLLGNHDFRPDGSGDLTTGAASNDVFFTGTFQQFFTDNLGGTLANDIMTTTAMYQNYSTVTDELYTDRDSVSGVDLNDEAMNMMQYQKSYSAACRLMTVVDELLDKLVNGTGRAGL